MTTVPTLDAVLQASREGANPFEGYTPSVPVGKTLSLGTLEFAELEKKGVEASCDSAFVLVAGGLGERLGYNGIKAWDD